MRAGPDRLAAGQTNGAMVQNVTLAALRVRLANPNAAGLPGHRRGPGGKKRGARQRGLGPASRAGDGPPHRAKNIAFFAAPGAVPQAQQQADGAGKLVADSPDDSPRRPPVACSRARRRWTGLRRKIALGWNLVCGRHGVGRDAPWRQADCHSRHPSPGAKMSPPVAICSRSLRCARRRSPPSSTVSAERGEVTVRCRIGSPQWWRQPPRFRGNCRGSKIPGATSNAECGRYRLIVVETLRRHHVEAGGQHRRGPRDRRMTELEPLQQSRCTGAPGRGRVGSARCSAGGA